MNVDESEQWLLDGRCEVCRRKNYCNKPCKREKKRASDKMLTSFTEIMIRHMVDKLK